jgi:hypothetical protein
MPEFGVEELEQLQDRISQLSERQAANARKLLEEIERRRREAREQDQNVVVPTAAQLLDRLQSANTPMFFFLGWNSSTPSPGTINLSVGVFNPDPVAADVGQALALVDARFPRLTEPEFFGLSLNPSDSATLNFSIAIPPNIEPSNYLGNCFLLNAGYFGVGQTLDRALFVFEVT